MSVKLTSAAALALAIVCLAIRPAFAQDGPLSGTWTVQPGSGGSVQLDLARHWDSSSWQWSSSVRTSDLNGFSASDLQSSGKNVRFALHKPAGSFDCVGWAAQGKGGGTFTFSADPSFAQALAARGLGAPTPDQQLELAMSGTTMAFIDMLRSAGMRPTLTDLMRVIDAGVDSDYVAGLAKYGITGLSVEDLIRLRNHGVEPAFVAALQNAGLRPSAGDLVELVDHGVSARYVVAFHRLGYSPDVSQFVRLVDHGVTTNWVQQVLGTGAHPSVDELIRMRDAGV